MNVKWSRPPHELCNPVVLSLQDKSMGSSVAAGLAESCIRLQSNVLDNNPDRASPAHMRAREVYTQLRLIMERPPQWLIK